MINNSRPTIQPIFIPASQFPTDLLDKFELCESAEKVSGLKSIYALQKYNGCFRLHTYTETQRTRLLGEGFNYLGLHVMPLPTNPKAYLVDGLEVETARLVISNIPLSIRDADIKAAVEDAGYEVLGELSLDCLRDKNGKLTEVRNGNRSATIAKPKKHLPKTVKLQGKFTAFLFYKEREEVERTNQNTKPKKVNNTGDDIDSDSENETRGDGWEQPKNPWKRSGGENTHENTSSQPNGDPHIFLPPFAPGHNQGKRGENKSHPGSEVHQTEKVPPVDDTPSSKVLNSDPDEDIFLTQARFIPTPLASGDSQIQRGENTPHPTEISTSLDKVVPTQVEKVPLITQPSSLVLDSGENDPPTKNNSLTPTKSCKNSSKTPKDKRERPGRERVRSRTHSPRKNTHSQDIGRFLGQFRERSNSKGTKRSNERPAGEVASSPLKRVTTTSGKT